MTFDALATAAIVDEFEATILSGRVQEVLAPDPLGIGLEIYANHQRYYLYATAHSQDARALLIGEKLRRGVEAPSPLMLLLRKYVKGRIIEGISQPRFERVIRLDIADPLEPMSLYIEVMGRHSNIILVDAQGTIVESVKRVPPSLSRRVVLPKHPYEPPPPQNKMSYVSLTPSRLASMLDEGNGAAPIWRRLVPIVAGMSPLLAREVVYRATGDAQATEARPEVVLAEIASLMGLAKTRAWEPCVAFEGEVIVAYAPYTLTHLPARESVASMSEAIARYYAQERPRDSYAEAKKPLLNALGEARSRLERRRESLQRSTASADEMQELMQKGQLILAYLSRIQPGQKELLADWGEGAPVSIELDPRLSPSENAQRYFREYDKLKSGAEQIPQLLVELEQEERYIAQLETDLEIAGNRPEIEQVRAALVEAGYLRSERPPKPAGSPIGRFVSADGYTILVGKNSSQNDKLTFQLAHNEDIWLHAQGIPGSHVIIVSEGRQVPESTLQQAAEAAAFYSRGRHDASVAVDYTPRSNVRQIPGGRPGQVTYRRYQTLRVAPHDWPAVRR